MSGERALVVSGADEALARADEIRGSQPDVVVIDCAEPAGDDTDFGRRVAVIDAVASHIGPLASLGLHAALSAMRFMPRIAEVMPQPQRPSILRARDGSGPRQFKPNGAREVARRLRQMQRAKG